MNDLGELVPCEQLVQGAICLVAQEPSFPPRASFDTDAAEIAASNVPSLPGGARPDRTLQRTKPLTLPLTFRRHISDGGTGPGVTAIALCVLGGASTCHNQRVETQIDPDDLVPARARR